MARARGNWVDRYERLPWAVGCLLAFVVPVVVLVLVVAAGKFLFGQ